MKITINPEYKALIPPLSAEEFEQLEKNLLVEGCRDPLVRHKGVLVDGHNRYELCEKHGLQYQWVDVDIDGDPRIWIIRNQFGRRNINLYQRADLGLVLEPLLAEKAKANQVKAGKEKLLQNSAEAVDTRKEVAKASGVSHDTIAKVKVINAQAPESVKEKLRSGDTTIHREYTKIKRESDRRELVQRIEAHKSEPRDQVSGLPELVLADPPWKYEFSETESRAIENQYPTCELADIATHSPVTEKDCILLLWATAPKLAEALGIMSAWGFEYRSCAVWDKVTQGMGYWFRGRHELLLVGVKGKAKAPAEMHRVESVFTEKRGAHSSKPECVYEWIETAFFDRVKLEMYCRAPRAGWQVWGNEV